MKIEILEEIAKNSENFEQLKKSLFHKKLIETSSKKEIFNFIFSSFLFFDYSNKSHFLNPLLGEVVTQNEKKYFIHGIFHDSAGIKLSKDFKLLIRDNLRNSNLICEDGLEKIFNLNCPNFGESEIYLSSLKINYLKDMVRYLFFSLSHEEKQSIIQEIKNIKNIDDFINVRKKLNYLPEPLGLTILASNLGYNSFIEVPPEKSRRIFRYVIEAKKAIDYAKNKDYRELHLLVGYAHEKPLAYLISNQDKLKNYIKKHKICL